MAASVQIPVTQTGLEASIQAALRTAGKGAQINLGTNSRQINALAQPLGRITGQADEFTKSMEAANARVFAFGASVGIINGVASAFSALVKSTIAVEKSLTEINSVFEKSSSELEKFGNSLFDVAKNTGQSFDAVAKGALELARQGLSTEESLRRINDALILTRLSGLDAERSVSGLTAAVNAFKSTGITTSEVLNKLVVVSQKYSVSEKDLIEGLKRSSSVAKQAGVSFDELVGIITAVQEKTSVGGAVIGNSFKTIFTRLQRTDTLDALQQLGVSVTDVQGRILPATKLLENLAGTIKSLNQVQLAEITERVGGGFQIDKLIATLEDLSSQSSVAFKATELSLKSTNEAYEKNAALNVTLAALINKTTLSAEQLGATLGKIGITDSAKSLLGFFNGLLEGIQKILGEESALGDVFRGLAKGIGNLVTGPGLALFAAIILKLSKDLAQFGFASLKGFFGIGKAAKEIQNVEQSIATALSRNVGLQRQLFALEGNRAAQIKLMSDAIVLQEAAMRRMASTASTLAAPLYGAGVRSTGEGLRVPKAAGGYMPAVSQESSDIKKGVGGARSGDRPVVIPNFNFGQGKKGSIVAHTGEYAVPNFAGSGGTAIFNRDMVRSMGLPSGAKKISASGGLIPNFANVTQANNIVKFNNYPVQEVISKKGSLQQINKVDTIDQFSGKVEIIEQKRNNDEYNKATNKLINQFWGKENKDGNNEKLNRILSSMGGKGIDQQYLARIRTSYGKRDYSTLRKQFKGALGELDAKKLSGQQLASGDAYMDLVGGGEIKTTIATPFSGIASKIMNDYLSSGPNLRNFTKDGKPKLDKVNTKKLPLYMPVGGKVKLNSAKGFIPNFADLADTIRQYYPDLESYRKEPGGKKFVFPNGVETYQSNIDNVLKRNPSIATVRKQTEDKVRQQKLKEGALDFKIDADTLGGIALVTPRPGDSSGYVSAKLKGSELKDNKPRGLLDDDQIILSRIQQTGVPTKKNFEQISSEINKFFAGPIVALAQSLYGRLYSGTQAGEFADQLGNLKSTSTGGILPAGAEGQIFEAASKAALTTMKGLSDSFDPKNENRPFDFTNPAAMNQMLGVKAVRGDAKRGGGSDKNFQGQVNTLVKKSMNDGGIAPKILSQISQQSKGRKSPNAAGGFIPNFAQTSNQIGSSGAQGGFYDLQNRFGNSRKYLGIKKFDENLPISALKNPIAREWLSAKYLKNRTIGKMVTGPKIVSGLAESIKNKSIVKEIIKDPLATNLVGSNQAGIFGTSILRNYLLQKTGLDIPDLHGRNYTANNAAKPYLLGQKALSDYSTDGAKINIIDTGLANAKPETMQEFQKLINQAGQKAQNVKSAAGGFIPNFFGVGQENDKSKIKDWYYQKYLGGQYTIPANMTANPSHKALYKLRPTDLFYHGSPADFDPSKIRTDRDGLVYLTRDLKHALNYAKGKKKKDKNGFVHAYSVKPNSLIFDTRKSENFAPTGYGKEVPYPYEKGMWNYSKNMPNKPIPFDNRLGNTMAVQRGFAASHISKKLGFAGSIQRQASLEGKDKLIPKYAGTNPKEFGFLGSLVLGIKPKSIKSVWKKKYDDIMALTDGGSNLNKFYKDKYKAAEGFLPNFANPLKDAIGREMAAGVPASQIYVDKNPSLKSIGNPMGLMVANRRDEPAGGYQGINRAIKEGRDPKTYGAASGFVPNYADAPDISEYVGKTRSVALSEEVKNYIKSLKELAKAYKDAKKDLQYIQNQRSPEAAAARDRIKAIKDDAKALKKSSEATRKAIIEQSKGIFGTGKTATLKETTVRAQGGQKDMLGTIFALQGAFSILSGYTENLTGRMGVVAKEITNLGSGLSTAAFAFQGAQRIATESTGKLGKFLGNLGMVGAGAMMAFEVFKFGKQLYSEYSGANERAAKSAIMLADAAQKAAFSLDKYSPAAQDRLNKRAEEIFKKLNIQGLQEVETVEVKKAIKDTLISGASNKLVEDALKESITTTKNYVTDRTTGERIEISETNTLTKDDLEGLTRRLTEVQQNTDITGLAKLQELILGGATAEDVSLNTALREMVGSLDDFDFAGIADRIEKSSIDELTQAENIIKNAVVNEAQLGGGSELATMLDREDFNLETALQFITQVIKKRKEDAEAASQAVLATEKQFKVDTSRFRAEQEFRKKTKLFTDAALTQEIAQKQAIFDIEQDLGLSEDEKKKKINDTNALYEQGLIILKNAQTQQENINKAISDSLSGSLNIEPTRLTEYISTLETQLGNFDISQGVEALTEKVEESLKNAEIQSPGLAEALTKALADALVQNQLITEDQGNQIKSKTILLDLENKTIDATTKRARIEAEISNTIEARQSTQLYQQELLSLDNSARMLSINQDIEKVKSNYTLTEYERAKKIVELEKEKKTLSEEGIDLESSQKRLDLEQKTLAELRQQVKASKDISNDKIKDKLILEGTNVESLATKAMAYKDTNAQNIYNEYLAQKDLIEKRDELARQGLITTGETADQAYLRKKEGGVFEGMNTALRAMTDEVDMFAYNLGEKIPQMFADNMSQAISQMIEEGKSFGEVLQGAAYNFVKEINSAMIKNLATKTASSLGSFIPGFASGGPITGGSGTKDDVPAMLMGGEYVINKKSVGKYGPQFLEAINNGTLGGYAQGGKVQSGKGGFFTPGTYGLGGIQGSGNLLKFATQAYTSGARDQIVNQGNYASINLEAESARLTNFGRSNSPQAEATRSAKEQAFGLYVQEIQAQEEARKQAEAEKDAFKKQLIMLGVTAVGSYVGGIAKTGFEQGIAGAASDATTWQKFTAGMSGVGEKFGNVGSGISSLFSGNMQQAGDYFSMARTNFASGAPKGNVVDEVVKSVSKSPSSGVSSVFSGNNGFNNSAYLPAPPSDNYEDYTSSTNGLSSLAYRELQNRQQVFDLVREEFEQDPRFFGRSNPVLIEALAAQKVSKLAEDNSIKSYLLGKGIVPRATGGSIPFKGGIDTVPAMLSGGEFIMNRSAAQNIGAGNLQALNAGAGTIVTEEKTEELNEKLISKLDELIEASGGASSITINVEGSTGAAAQSTNGNPTDQRQQMARQIKDAVLKILQDEKRLGGQLRR
jgi:TP901 family phage tail tape measure protein